MTAIRPRRLNNSLASVRASKVWITFAVAIESPSNAGMEAGTIAPGPDCLQPHEPEWRDMNNEGFG